MPSDQYWTRTENGVELLERSTFAREDELQELISSHPELLARSVDDDQNARWLSIDREVRITFAEDEDTSHWRLDNLFIDGHGVPTLVEVKRSSDPRVRREVVAQLLDYAASFHADWSHGKLRDVWLSGANNDRDLDQSFDDFLSASAFDTETALWDAVDTNVSAGRLRLLIVCDQLGGRLVRIIRFLNQQMGLTEVLGVAIQPRGAEGGQRTLSVEVEGALDVPRTASPSNERREESEFWEMLGQQQSVAEAGGVREMVSALLTIGDSYTTMGSDAADPCLFVNYRTKSAGADTWPLKFSPKHGRVYIQMRTLKNRPGFESDDARHECRERMRVATGHPISVGSLQGQPYFTIDVLRERDQRSEILDVVRWILDEIAASTG